MPTPSLASRASARVFPSSSCSEISTGQLSTVVMAAHLLPDAGAAVLRLAVTPPASARPGSQVKSLISPPGEFLLLGRPNLYQDVAENLRVKEVRIAEDERFVICHSPEG